MKENRRYRRLDCDLPAHWSSHRTGTGRLAADVTVNDISEGGVRFRTARFLPVGEPVVLKVDLPKRPQVEATIRPAWITELPHLSQFEIGASFLSISDDHLVALRDFMKAVSSSV